MENLNLFSKNTLLFFGAVILIIAIIGIVIRSVLRNKSIRRIKKANSYVDALNELIAGNNERAQSLFKEAVRFDTNNIDAYVKLGMLYRLQGNSAQALKIHKDLAIRPGLKVNQLVEIYRNIINDLIDLKQYDMALTNCEKLLSVDSGNKWALDIQPVIFEQKKDFKNAFKYLKARSHKTLETDHKLALYKISHGKELMERGEYHDARILFKEGIKLDKSLPASYLYLGDAYAREDRQDDAVKVWREFADTVPQKSHLVFDFLESAYFASGNYAAMESFYTDIIEKDPDNYRALLKLGEICFKKGDREKALEMTERSFRLNPRSPEGLKNLILYLNQSDDIQVIKEKALSLAELTTESQPFRCTHCGHETSEILIKCPECGNWDTFEL